MLICPQCELENPDQNKFCQHCGTSLVEKECEQCGAQVHWSASHCPNCNHLTGSIWLALVSPVISEHRTPSTLGTFVEEEIYFEGADAPDSKQSSLDVMADEVKVDEELSSPGTEVSPLSSDSPPKEPTSHLPGYSGGETDSLGEMSYPDDSLTALTTEVPEVVTTYLDPQHRYQILTPTPLTVLDTQPLQPSPFRVYLQNPDLASASTPIFTIPQAVQPYLQLSAEFPLEIPAIHDAWETDQQTVILTQDLSHLPSLLTAYQETECTEQQLVKWLQNMVNLWIALTPVHCRQSLLEAENLRVYLPSPDLLKPIILQALYADPVQPEITLKDLGKFWHNLFNQGDSTQFNILNQFINQIMLGHIQTPEDLAHELRQYEIQHFPLPPSTTRLQPTVARTSDSDLPTPITTSPQVQLISLDSEGDTHVGKQRDHNEDSFKIWTQSDRQSMPEGDISRVKGLYILCDGMGGHDGGEVASQIALDTLTSFFQTHWHDDLPNSALIQEAILLTNQTIYQDNKADSRSGSGRMGTTLVMALIQDTEVAVSHVGDSRLYRLQRDHPLEQITVDHEVGMREIQRGIDPEIAYSRPDAYQLTQALGPRDNQFVRPDIQFFPLETDTLLILASDGLTDNNLLETHQNTHLLPLLEPEANLETGVQNLIDLANTYNGHDNITVIVIRALVQPRPNLP